MAITKFVFFILSVFNVCALDNNSTTLPTATALLENLHNVTVKKESVHFCQNSTMFLTKLLNVTERDLNDFTENFERVKISEGDVKFFQYSPNSNQSIEISPYSLNPEHPTKILIHGWLQNANSHWVQEMAFLYHKKGNYNIIAVDWSTHAGLFGGYSSAASAAQGAGFRVGEFILAKQKHMTNFLQNLHLIGFSLGAHVAGFAGKKVRSKEQGYIDRITGLDVAAPLFETLSPQPPYLRLNRTDAVFVDLIHTNIGVYGVKNAYGTADFYVNKGGPIQPGCLTCVCSHNSATTVFSQSINDPKVYEAISCPNTIEFNLELCKEDLKVFMGDEVTRHASGTYYLDANV